MTDPQEFHTLGGTGPQGALDNRIGEQSCPCLGRVTDCHLRYLESAATALGPLTAPGSRATRPAFPCHPLATAIDGRGVRPDVGQVLETRVKGRELVSQEPKLCSEVTVVVMVLGQEGSSPSSARRVPQVPPGQLPFQRPDPAEDAAGPASSPQAPYAEQEAARLPAAGGLGRLWKFTTIWSFFSNRSSLFWPRMTDLMSSTFTRLMLPPQKAFEAESRGSSLPLHYLHVWSLAHPPGMVPLE